MIIFSKLKKEKENKEIKHLLINSTFDLIIYTLIFLVIFILLRMGLKNIFDLNSANRIIETYKEAITYTVNHTIYVSIITIIVNIGTFVVYLFTVLSSFKKKLINKNNYKAYIIYMIISILLLSSIAGILIIYLSFNSLLCISHICKVSDLSFYNYELEVYSRLSIGLVLDYAIWTFITIAICTNIIKYLHNKKILIKEKKSISLKRLFKKKNK